MEAPPVLGRVPPHSEGAERGLLGSVLLDCERVLDLATTRNISGDSFYFRANALVYETMFDLNSRGIPVDLLTVSDRLRTTQQLEDIGGPFYLQGLVDSTPTAVHAEHYIEMVHDNFLLREIINRAREAGDKCYDPDLDADTVLSQTEESFFGLNESKPGTIGVWSELIKHQVEEINSVFENKRGVTGIGTGYRDLDKILTGMHKTDMLVLAARPSMGKTSLALNIAEHVAIGTTDPEGKQRPVAVFSLEMSKEQLVRRMLCSNANVPFHILSGQSFFPAEIHGRLLDAAGAIQNLPIYIDDTAGLDVLDLRARARRMQRRYNIEFIVVDYLQLMHCSRVRENRQQEVSAISGHVKAMAKELNVPVLVLSQLSRSPEQRDKSGTPKLSDLRDSGAIEQDADVVILLRRPSRYPGDPEYDDKRLSIVDVAKHRNGPVGEVRLDFEDSYTRFSDRTEHEEHE